MYNKYAVATGRKSADQAYAFLACARQKPQAILLRIVKAFNNKQVKITLCIINMLSGRGENLRIKRMRFCLCEAKAAGNTCRIVKAFNNAHVKNTLYIINMLSRRAGKSEEKDEMFLSVQGELRRQYSCGIVKELNEVTGGNRRFFT